MLRLQLSTIQNPSIEVGATLPPGWNAIVMTGSKITRLTGEDGHCTAQAIDGDVYAIRYIVTHFMQKLRLWIPPNDMVLQVWMALKSDFIANVRGLGKIQLREGEFAIIHAPRTAMEAAFKANKDHQLVEVGYTLPVVEEMYESYPEAEAFREAMRDAKPFIIGAFGIPMTHYEKDALMNVLRSNFPGRDKTYYLRMKVRELLFLTFRQALSKDGRTQAVSEEVAQKLQKLYEALNDNLAHHFSVPEMAAIAGMSVYTVADAFKKRYGVPPTAYHLSVRMQKAHALTLTTDLPFKAIATMVGYRGTTNLLDAFQAFYGYYPGSLRRKKS